MAIKLTGFISRITPINGQTEIKFIIDIMDLTPLKKLLIDGKKLSITIVKET
jgi:hypothetical protein